MAFKDILHLPIETMRMSKGIRLKRYASALLSHNTALKMLNLLRIESELRRRATFVKGLPYVLKIESTNQCNYRCPVCYEGRKAHNFEGARGFGKMHEGVFHSLIDEIGRYVYRINLYGFGEPFLYEKTLSMVRYASHRNISVGITSNFSTVDDESMELILQSGLEHLIVSIDGIDQASYEKYQVGGNFNKIISNLTKFQEMKIRLGKKLPQIDWQFLVMRHNAHMLRKARTMAHELGMGIRFSYIGVDLHDPVQREKWLPKHKSLSNYDYTKLAPKNVENLRVCPWLYRTVFVNWDGGVSPCCNYYTGNKLSDFGSLNDNCFREIWNNRSYLVARQLVSKKKPLTDEDKRQNVCGRCETFFS
jgi:MoaA/NifB/PqqE/SkfB family radical SAM enzyme